MFISIFSTPAVWPKGGTLLSAGGPCLSGASWSALLWLASIFFNETRRGVTGFGSFCQNKRTSAAGPNPGNTEHHVDTKVGNISTMPSPNRRLFTGKPQDRLALSIGFSEKERRGLRLLWLFFGKLKTIRNQNLLESITRNGTLANNAELRFKLQYGGRLPTWRGASIYNQINL